LEAPYSLALGSSQGAAMQVLANWTKGMRSYARTPTYTYVHACAGAD